MNTFDGLSESDRTLLKRYQQQREATDSKLTDPVAGDALLTHGPLLVNPGKESPVTEPTVAAGSSGQESVVTSADAVDLAQLTATARRTGKRAVSTERHIRQPPSEEPPRLSERLQLQVSASMSAELSKLTVRICKKLPLVQRSVLPELVRELLRRGLSDKTGLDNLVDTVVRSILNQQQD